MATQQEHEDVNDCQIMTVLGPKSGLGAQFGPFMMHEHVISNVQPIATPNDIQSHQQPPLKLENLSSIRLHPFDHFENMNLASENVAFEELQNLANSLRTDDEDSLLTILDMTTAANGRDHKACQRIANRLRIHILVGTTCLTAGENNQEANATVDSRSRDMELLQRNIEHMERELKFGIGTTSEDDYKNLTSNNNNDVVRSSFCGPATISKDFTASERRELQAFAAVQGATKAPLIVVPSSLSAVSTLLDFIQNSGGALEKTVVARIDKLVHQCAAETNSETAMTMLREQVLQRGVTVCFDQFSLKSACFDFDQVYPSITTVVDLVSALLRANPSYIHQMVIGCGIVMKLQYKKYGGSGYPIVMDELVPRLMKRGGLTNEQIDMMLSHNPVRLLQWWRPPPVPEKPKSYLTCSICNIDFEPVLGEYFTKYAFIYCGTKCLRKHRKLGFKELKATKTV